MPRRRTLLASAALLAAPAVHAQGAFPGNRQLTLIVGWAAGGVGDALMRPIAEYARTRRGAQAIVENRPGAGSALALERTARAAPDGTTVTLASPTALLVVPQLQPVPYDPLGFTFLGQLSVHPLPVYVRAASPFRTWADFVAHARANPGRLSWGTTGSRSFAEIVVGEALKKEGVETNSVPFRGGSEAISSLLGGHVDAVASTDFGPLLAQGEVRLLVETGPNKIPSHPDVPTFAELGYPIAEPVAYGVVGPANLPAPIAAWWNDLLRDICADPAYADMVRRLYGQVQHLDATAHEASIRAGHAKFAAALRGSAASRG